MNEYKIKAHAKINLGLDVIRRRPDGYHEVKMIMQSIGLCDELTLEKAPAGITLTTDHPELSCGEDNLIYKAAKLMLDTYHISGGIRIHLQKKIPIAAGMAGGSTDAAAAMKGISRLFDLEVPLEQLMKLGMTIGADVPYCILGGTALAEGIGEKLTPLTPAPDFYILVAKPGISVSTKYVYEHLDAAGIARHPDIDGMVLSIESGSLQGILDRMGNVLETVTIPAHPEIDSLKRRIRELGAVNSLMSGSGPTVFGVFLSEQAAEFACEQLRSEKLAKQVFLTTPT
ncbi:MAG: 4-(cytidine 5'-diphospho)-2-C-methyl-D-erythritol kinase [Acetatifactor sp.]|nr:4-(cytidine 5'-diphospho)-2-C-methyl-D-erythritol kinase [Acetatifactor sp.]